MLKVDPTAQTLMAAGIIAIAISVLLNGTLSTHSQEPRANGPAATVTATGGPLTKSVWAASATGRVEPKDGEVRLIAGIPGKIVKVVAKANDRVAAGDVLVVVDDADLVSKREAAIAEEVVRVRERDEEEADPKAPPQIADRRAAEDAAAAAERAVFAARRALDEAVIANAGGATPAIDIAPLRQSLSDAEKAFKDKRAAMEKAMADASLPLPNRLESGLTIARTDLTQIENAIERTRIRAPYDGTVLNIWAKLGETAVTSPEAPLVLFGNVETLRVRTEVEERDVMKIKVGQKAVIRGDAFPDREFTGTVTSMAPALGSPRILSRGPRRPNDVEVLEVFVTLDETPPLLTGMRVDVFFKSDEPAS